MINDNWRDGLNTRTDSSDWRDRYLGRTARTDSASPKEQVIGLVLAMGDAEAQALLQQLTGGAQARTDGRARLIPDTPDTDAADAARAARIKQIENASR